MLQNFVFSNRVINERNMLSEEEKLLQQIHYLVLKENWIAIREMSVDLYKLVFAVFPYLFRFADLSK